MQNTKMQGSHQSCPKEDSKNTEDTKLMLMEVMKSFRAVRISIGKKKRAFQKERSAGRRYGQKKNTRSGKKAEWLAGKKREPIVLPASFCHNAGSYLLPHIIHTLSLLMLTTRLSVQYPHFH